MIPVHSPFLQQNGLSRVCQFLGKKPERVPVFIWSGKTVLSDGVSNYKHQNIKGKIWLNTTVVFRSILAKKTSGHNFRPSLYVCIN